MPNTYFRFREFTVNQQFSAMKVCTDACLFGAWTAGLLENAGGRFLDVGTGTGLLSLMIAQKTSAVIDAIEIDEPAFLEAKDNFNASPWSERISAIHTPVQDYFPDVQYDAVFSNPPFYEDELKSADGRRNLALHSAELDLTGLFGSVERLLKANGLFAILFPYKRKNELEGLITKYGWCTLQQTLVKQSPGRDAFRCMYLISNTKSDREQSVEEISIREEDDRYTARFCQLLNDYYLFDKRNEG